MPMVLIMFENFVIWINSPADKEPKTKINAIIDNTKK